MHTAMLKGSIRHLQFIGFSNIVCAQEKALFYPLRTCSLFVVDHHFCLVVISGNRARQLHCGPEENMCSGCAGWEKLVEKFKLQE